MAKRSETTATAVGSPPAPRPEKTTSPPKRPLATTIFWVPWDHAMGEVWGMSMGPTRAWTIAPARVLSSCAVETWRMVQPSSLAYMKSIFFDGGDGLGGDLVGIELGLEGDAGEDAELGAGVEAVDVGAWVGFGIAEGLRVGEDVGVVGSGFHAAEHVVACAVEDAADAGDVVGGLAVEEAGDDGDAAGYGCSVDELDGVSFGEAQEACAAIGDELLVGRDDGFARGDGGADPGFGGLEAAHELNDDVDFGGEDIVDVPGPDGVGGDVLCGGRSALALDVAVVDVGQFEAGVLPCREHAGDGAAYGSEAEDGYLDWVAGCFLLDHLCGAFRRRHQ